MFLNDYYNVYTKQHMKRVGVIVARFQVPSLHKGHTYLIDYAVTRSDVVLIFLGYKVNQPDTKNPYTLSVRKGMLMQMLRTMGIIDSVVVSDIEDHPISNELWSEDLDKKISEHIQEIYDEEVHVTLYGSRDSFVRSYYGKYEVATVDELQEGGESLSGTKLRQKVLLMNEEELTREHREGIVYGLSYMYPVGMSVVDVLVYKKEKGVYYFY
jgi:bifunctional NMN adenylyltransferase/nudix hydrolase